MTTVSSNLLASGDEAQPHPLDAAVWRDNLAALRNVDAALADLLADTRLPPQWRAVQGLDGFPTWRTETPGAPPAWLGGTALPRRRAAALLGSYQSGDRNPALPTLGTGAEALELLERLPLHIAVYIFLDDLIATAAVLRTTPLAPALAAGRLILIPPDDPRTCLTALLAERPGLLPPASLLLPDCVSAERVSQLKTWCQTVAEETNTRRAAELAALRIAATPRDRAPPRVAVLALQPAGPTHALAAVLARGAGALGWPVHVARVDGPAQVDGLCHVRELAALRPSVTLGVNHLPSVLPVPVPEPACAWVLSAAQAAALPAADDALRLAASPTVAAALRAAGVAEERIVPWFWACEDAPPPAAPASPSGVMLIGDRPPDRPESQGITQDTHRQLWETVRVFATRAWETPLGANAEQLLVRAEQQTGVRLRDAAIREHFLQAVAEALVPAVTLTAVAEELARQHRVLTVGAGWEAWKHPRHIRHAATTMLAPPDAGAEPLACVAAGGRDPLSAALVAAAAAGRPIVVHRPAGGPPPALGEVLRPGVHCETFVDTRDLRRLVQLSRAGSSAVRERAARAAAHVRAFHSYRQRWQDLMRRLGIAWA